MNSNNYSADDDMPVIDLDEGSIRRLIAHTESRGVISAGKLDAALPRDQMSMDQIKDMIAAISEMGIPGARGRR